MCPLYVYTTVFILHWPCKLDWFNSIRCRKQIYFLLPRKPVENIQISPTIHGSISNIVLKLLGSVCGSEIRRLVDLVRIPRRRGENDDTLSSELDGFSNVSSCEESHDFPWCSLLSCANRWESSFSEQTYWWCAIHTRAERRLVLNFCQICKINSILELLRVLLVRLRTGIMCDDAR